jgi:ferredoxin
VKVRVDPQRCQGHTLCAMIAPDMFALSDLDGTSSAVCDVVPADQEELVREAARSCPEQAILIEETKNGSSVVTVGQAKTRGAMS